MPDVIRIRRGYDIKLKGAAVNSISRIQVSGIIGVKPSDFPNVKPKLLVSPGEIIQAGQCLFIDKLRPDLRFTSPVSGEITDIIIGEKRRILEIRILPDKSDRQYVHFSKSDPSSLPREQIVEQLQESGCWNYIRQRPFSVIADKNDTPKAIFISCFDTSPLAPDLSFLIAQEKENFTTGIKAIQNLAEGNLHIGLKAGSFQTDWKTLFPTVKENHIHYFSGPHPSGNVGIQIHHISPVQKGEVVWYVHPQDVIIIGRLFAEGQYRADRLIALTGSQVSQPRYIQALYGQQIDQIIGEKVAIPESRIIQGNVLHGQLSSPGDYLSFYNNHISIIPEGNKPEFLGWLLPGLNKLSLSRTYFSWIRPQKSYTLDTNLHGEERAFVMTGQYDKVLPMNIYPVYLLKAILARDIEKMEALGIYEVAEEDFALCEFVCTSKVNVQQIIAEGLELIREEG